MGHLTTTNPRKKKTLMEIARNTVEVAEGEYVSLPETKDYCVAGPAKVTFVRHHNNTVSHTIDKGVSSPMAAAIKHRLKRVAWGV